MDYFLAHYWNHGCCCYHHPLTSWETPILKKEWSTCSSRSRTSKNHSTPSLSRICPQTRPYSVNRCRRSVHFFLRVQTGQHWRFTAKYCSASLVATSHSAYCCHHPCLRTRTSHCCRLPLNACCVLSAFNHPLEWVHCSICFLETSTSLSHLSSCRQKNLQRWS